MKDNLEILSRVLGRCIIFTLVTVFIWFVAYMLADNMLCKLQGQMFELSQHECALLNYAGMGLMKIVAITLFLFPWLAIRLEMGRRKRD